MGTGCQVLYRHLSGEGSGTQCARGSSPSSGLGLDLLGRTVGQDPGKTRAVTPGCCWAGSASSRRESKLAKQLEPLHGCFWAKKNPKQVSFFHISAKSTVSPPGQAQKCCCCVGLGTRPCFDNTVTGLCQGTGPCDMDQGRC